MFDSTRNLALYAFELIAIALPLSIAPRAISQTPTVAAPEFEVAAIKPSRPDQDEIRIDIDGRHLTTQGTTLTYLIQFAYGVHAGQVIGGPDGRSSQRYDISAEADSGAQIKDGQLDMWKLMLQTLLEDRFKLKVHREQRLQPAFAIVVGKNGARLTKSTGDPDGHADFSRSDGKGKVVAKNATMGDFAGILQDTVLRDQSVVDQTHLTGRFDFTLEFTPDQSEYRGRYADRPVSDDSPPSFFTAVQDELGLKLESVKVPVDVLVVDHFEATLED